MVHKPILHVRYQLLFDGVQCSVGSLCVSQTDTVRRWCTMQPGQCRCVCVSVCFSGCGPDGMAEWFMVLDRFEWLALVNSGVLGVNPAQVSDCTSILSGLGRYPGRSV